MKRILLVLRKLVQPTFDKKKCFFQATSSVRPSVGLFAKHWKLGSWWEWVVGGIVKFLLIKKIDFCGPTTDYINALRLCSYRGKLIFEWVKKLSFPGEKFLHQVFATIFVEHIVTYLVLSSLFNKIIYFHKFTKMNLEQ